MAREKHWLKFGPVALTSDGGTEGQVVIPDTCGLFVKQKVILQSSTAQLVKLEIKRILSRTELIVGPDGQSINKFSNLSAFTVADGSAIRSDEQSINHVPPADIQQAIYAREPVVAVRNIPVDWNGNFYSIENPFPVQLSDGNIEIGTVEANIEVHTTHLDNSPEPGRVHDSMRIGDGQAIAKVDTKNESFSVNRYEKILPLLANAKWLELVNYEEVTTVFAGDVATISYLQGGNTVAKAIFTFATDFDWSFKLESYINNDDGDTLLDDDGSPLFLD